MRDYFKIALTGGPCSGKSSAKKFLMKELEKLGWSAIFVPEAATVVIGAGLDPRRLSAGQHRQFQHLLLEHMEKAEHGIFEAALAIKKGARKVMICDRGVPDIAAYMRPVDFQELLSKFFLDIVSARDARYDAAFHLVTAADGAEKHYNRKNSSRLENRAAARLVDGKTQQAWLGHPHLRIVDNSTNFKGKMKRLLTQVKKALGIPNRLETERKFLLKEPPNPDRFPVPVVPVEIRQTYLADRRRTRVRARGQNGEGVVYYKTRKIQTAKGISSIEHENQINEPEYLRLLKSADPNLDEIRKIRYHFVYRNQYFELDRFLAPARLRNMWLLEIELTEEDDQVRLPKWLGPVTEVTEDCNYKNRKLAKRP